MCKYLIWKLLHFGRKQKKWAILILGTVVESPKTEAVSLTEAVEAETNVDAEDEEIGERIDNLKKDNIQILEQSGKQKHSFWSTWLSHLFIISSLYN